MKSADEGWVRWVMDELVDHGGYGWYAPDPGWLVWGSMTKHVTLKKQMDDET